MFIRLVLLSFTSLVLLVGCGPKDKKFVDVGEVQVDLDTVRYERLVWSLDTAHLLDDLADLRARDTALFDLYFVRLMNFGPLADTAGPMSWMVRRYLSNPADQALHDTVQAHFPGIGPQVEAVRTGLRHVRYHLPDLPLPRRLATVTTGFGWKAVTLDTMALVIGLDMYLGEDFVHYPALDYPFYLIRRFTPEHLPRDAMEVVYDQHWAGSQAAATPPLLHAMVENGKKLLFLEFALPHTPDHVLMGYTPDQLAWCAESEEEIWMFYNDKDIFYSTDHLDHRRHVRDGPMTPGMPSEAPGNVGSWVGWQIVRSYMRTADASLSEVLDTPAETIIATSRYKP